MYLILTAIYSLHIFLNVLGIFFVNFRKTPLIDSVTRSFLSHEQTPDIVKFFKVFYTKYLDRVFQYFVKKNLNKLSANDNNFKRWI